MRATTSDSPAARALKARMRSELRWLRLRLAGHALLIGWVSVALLLLAAVVSQPGWTRLGPAAAWGLWAAVVVSVLWSLIAEFLRPVKQVANLKGFSRQLEEHGDYRNLLETATQFSSRRREDPLVRGASAELVEEILRRAADAARSMQLAPRIPLSGLLYQVPSAIGLALLWLLLAWQAPDRVHATLHALAHPSSLAHPEPTTGLYALSGDLRVPVGETVELVARDFVGGPTPVVLEVDRTGGFWQQYEVRTEAGEGRPPQYFVERVRLDDVEDPFVYRFRKGELLSDEHRVEIRQRPVLTQLSLRVEAPEYTGRPTLEVDDPSGTLDLLAGSTVILRGTASSPLSSARRRLVEGGIDELEVEGTRFHDRFVLDQDQRFHLDLIDADGLAGETNTVYVLLARPDQPPVVEITEPAEDRHLDRSLKIGIAGLAADDLGLREVALVWRLETDEPDQWRSSTLFADGDAVEVGAEVQQLEIDRGDAEVALAFTWDLGDVELLPGDAVLYALEATDNDGLAGPKTTRSAVYRLRLPTVAEVFDLDRGQREEDTGELQSLRDEGRELAEDLRRLERELKKNPDPDWDRQQEIKDVLERQKQLREKLEDSAEQLRRQQEDFQRENAGSLETLQKMEMVQELLEDLKDDQSLQAYLEAMEEAMERLGPQEIQRQMQDSLADQEEFNRRLDRTIELLRQLERERAMSDLTEEVADHLQRQEDLAEKTDPTSERSEESADSQDPTSETGETDESSATDETDENAPSDEDLARAQEQLEKEAEALEQKLAEQLEQLREQMEQEGSDPVAEQMEQSLEEALEQMQQQGKPSESMEDAGERLEQGDRQRAQESQQEAMERLLHLYQALSEGMQGMQQASGEAAFEKLQQTAFDLLDLSHDEEDVADALRGGIRGQQIQPIARRHARVARGASRLSDSLHDLAQKNFMIPERLLGEMRNLVELLDDGTEELKLSRARRSRDVAVESMAKMNQIVINLLTAAQNAQSGGGSGAQPSPSQQMQQMSEEQSRLNGMTQELRRKMSQGFSAEERRQLAEMQQRQQALRQQLQELREQIEDERRVLADLDEIERNMEEVAEDLGAGRLDEDTQRQQEKILSRLLDAQRSVRERDFAKRREARGSEELFRPQVGVELPNLGKDEEGRLRRWMAPDAAPRAYRDEVRRYFRSLEGKLSDREER